jgi:hypothetical protein
MIDTNAYFISLTSVPLKSELGQISDRIFAQVFRQDFSAPGVALISLGRSTSSTDLRAFMVSLKESLNTIYTRHISKSLTYLSMARFNQQVTTKFHLDGAPDEAYLMLGYEPTDVQSTLSIADYSKAAYEWGIEPKTLLAEFNPMYPGNEKRLLPYVTRLEAFDPSAAQVVLLNNSSLPYRLGAMTSLGVMHQATIVTRLPDCNRVVNSTMIASGADVTLDSISKEVQQAFIDTQVVAGEVKP